jgi:hypothetical protein
MYKLVTKQENDLGHEGNYSGGPLANGVLN